MADEYLLSAARTGDNGDAHLVRLANGTYAALWVRERAPGQMALDEHVMLRLLDASGVPGGAAIDLGPGGDGFEQPGAIAVAALGSGFVLVRGLDGDDFDNAGMLRVTRHDARGQQIGTAVDIGADDGGGRDGSPAIAAFADGHFLVGWADGATARVQRFAADGTLAGSPISLSASGEAIYGLTLDRVGEDRVLATWQASTDQDPFTRGLNGRLLDGGGVPTGPAFAIERVAGDDASSADVALLDDGSYVIAWQSGRNETDVHFRRYAADGSAIGEIATANSDPGNAGEPSVLALPDRGFVIAWRAFDPVSGRGTVIGQTFDLQGGRIAYEFALSTDGALNDEAPDLALAADNRVLATWGEQTFDGQFVGNVKARLIDYTQGIARSGGTGIDRLDGTSGQDVLAGGDGDDILTGLAGDDRLIGGVGNDQLRGGPGRDVLEGGAGNDSYVVGGEGTLVIEGADGGRDLVIADGPFQFVLPANVELLTLGAGTLWGAGNALGNVVTGNAAANRLEGGGGDDEVSGRDGDDIITGGEDADRLFGDAGSDTLYGGAGRDQLDGGASADRLIGGDGDDRYLVDDSGDIIEEGEGQGRDLVTASVSYSLSADVEDLLLTGSAASGTGNAIANEITGTSGANMLSGLDGDDRLDGLAGDDRLFGGEGRDTLIGRDGADMLDGGAGSDALSGGAGDDLYIVDDGRDATLEGFGGGIDTVRSSVSHTLYTFVEDLELTGAASTGRGNEIANHISGNAAANGLLGAGGDDWLEGGDGDDSLYGGAGRDRIDGGAGRDLLDGGAGADLLTGGADNDSYLVDDAGDTVVEQAGGGYDTIQTTISLTLSAEIERLVLAGTTAIDGVGNRLDNLLNGNQAANRLDGLDGADQIDAMGGADMLFGGAGADILRGGAGNDLLEGGIGADVLSGGAGADLFRIGGGETGSSFATADRILDFASAEGDRIDLAGIDADAVRGGDQAFAFIGSAAFSGLAGELRAVVSAGVTYLFADINGDAVADLTFSATSTAPIVAGDFIL